jgi:UDP-N-acetylmuramyl tripeptide synthase
VSVLGAKVAAARTLGSAVRRSGRGGGTSLPGRVMLKLEPDAIGMLAARLPLGSAVISATNGKTTTAAMTAEILRVAGISLVHNRAGANMAGGIAATLVDAARRGGRISGRLGLFEVDEFWLGQLTAALVPRALLLGNLFRDQLDRYGELDTIADRWAEVVEKLPVGDALVLNADDPLIADLGRQRGNVLYFGVEDRSVAVAEMQHAADSKHCRNCGSAYQYDAIYLGHLGLYHCPNCGQARPQPSVSAQQIQFRGTTGVDFRLRTGEDTSEVSLPLPGLYNVYNALGAAALCRSLGVPHAQIVAGLKRVAPAFGRAETVIVEGTELQLLLIKNPAGANEVLRTLALPPEDGPPPEQALDVLAVLNDQIADGRDISWVWDADWELLTSAARQVTCAGTRAAELALRLKYAGVPVDRLRVIPSLPAALDHALASARDRRVYVLPTYTALLALRDELTARGHVSAYWDGAG